MGIDLQLESEAGEVIQFIGDGDGIFLKAALDGRLNSGSLCLRFVDPFGDTVFNRVQYPYLLEEIEYLNLNATDSGLKNHTKKVLNLLRKSRNETHGYFRFIGD